MQEERKLTFGKYKGQDIKYIILTHIGYIMWCFDNIDWFKLTDEEQALYDAIAIMIKKERLPMTFPVEMMYKHIKDREAFERLKTPFIFNGEYTAYKVSEKDNPICKSIEKYRIRRAHGIRIQEGSSFGDLSLGDLGGFSHSMNKEIERARLNGESDEEIYGGWGSMNDYKD
ncbi:exodeoxyribonuclease X C-terminal domain-containing protein [Bacteroides finegoldii]|uniref:exodeoxyribonuclease X C-terminal domain-containing protein n=1 Tax=Bacteroides finegoldii TaxID=338188 RepID=UPI00189DED46|nr:hypothetical protein [Bacteroides finegoldii]